MGGEHGGRGERRPANIDFSGLEAFHDVIPPSADATRSQRPRRSQVERRHRPRPAAEVELTEQYLEESHVTEQPIRRQPLEAPLAAELLSSGDAADAQVERAGLTPDNRRKAMKVLRGIGYTGLGLFAAKTGFDWAYWGEEPLQFFDPSQGLHAFDTPIEVWSNVTGFVRGLF